MSDLDVMIRQPKPLRGDCGFSTDTRPHTVYLLLDEDGHVVYVGCSRNVEQRIEQHHSAEFWPLVARTYIVGTWERRMALDVEWGLIQKYQPCGNFVGTDRWREDMKIRHQRAAERAKDAQIAALVAAGGER